MTEKQIQKLIHEKYSRNNWHKFIINNVYFYKWETDTLSVESNDEVCEFEIKDSKWDYLNDHKKFEKHDLLNARRDFSAIPNRFYYVFSDKVKVEIDNIPEYAGLIQVKKSGMNYYLKEIKAAPQLHAEKLSVEMWQDLAIKAYYKLNN